jgi:hypothetical protein
MRDCLFSNETSFKKTCKFFNAAILISIYFSFKNLSILGNKSSSVYFGPKILASSWILAAKVFFIFGSAYFDNL